MKAYFTSIMVALLLAACGGGSGGSGGAGNQRLLDDVEATADSLEALAESEGPTDYNALPTSGQARYNGYAALVNEDDDSGFLGTAQLTADFSDDSFSGRVDAIRYGVDDGVSTPSLSPASGSLTIANGSISDLSGMAAVDAEVDGTLVGGGKTVSVSGDVSGIFVGDTYDGVTLVADSDMIDVTENGMPSSSYDLLIIGER